MDRAARGYGYTALAFGAMYALHTQQGLAVSRRGMEIAPRLRNQALWATAAAQRAYHLVGAGRLAEARTLHERAWETADGLNDAFAAWFAGWCGGMCHFDLLDAARSEMWFERELAKPRLAEPSDQRQVLQRWLARARAEEGDLLAARALLAEASSAAGWVQSADAAEDLHWLLPFRAGAWEEARDRAVQGREACRDTGAWGPEAEWTRCLAQVHRARGEVRQAEALLYEALALVEGDCLPSEVKARAQLARLYAETGRPLDAEPHLAGCRRIMANGEDWGGLAACVAAAEAAVAAAQGRWDGAQAHFEQAIATFRRYRLPWEEAEAFFVWGRALLAAGRDSIAAEKLDAALEIYRRCGAGEPWVRRVAGAKSRGQHAAGYRDGLTQREAEVLRLLALGRSSRQIASELVLSVRTVERHISNIYGKIDVRTRAQATAYALRNGLA